MDKKYLNEKGKCPLCGSEIEYTEDEEIEYTEDEIEMMGDEEDGAYLWNCPNCGAEGQEGYKRVFTSHHFVYDGNNKLIDIG